MYGGLDRRDSDVSHIIDKAAARPTSSAPGTVAPADLTAWAAKFQTITVDPAAGVPGAIRRLEKAIAETTPLSYAVMSRGTLEFARHPLDVQNAIVREHGAPAWDVSFETGRDTGLVEPFGFRSAPLPWWIQLPLLAVAGDVGWFVSVRRKG